VVDLSKADQEIKVEGVETLVKTVDVEVHHVVEAPNLPMHDYGP
jgi:hypothetical protein